MKTTMHKVRSIRAFTLVEIMITLAVIGIVAAIAVPMYSSYISDSRQAVMKQNIESIRLFEKNYEAEYRVYVSGTYDPSNPSASNGLKTLIGWEPRTEKSTITYVVACATPNSDTSNPQCARTSGYYVTGTDSDDNSSLCVAFEGASCP